MMMKAGCLFLEERRIGRSSFIFRQMPEQEEKNICLVKGFSAY